MLEVNMNLLSNHFYKCKNKEYDLHHTQIVSSKYFIYIRSSYLICNGVLGIVLNRWLYTL